MNMTQAQADAQADALPEYGDGFAILVRELLAKVPEVSRTTIDNLYTAILDAYTPRMLRARREASDAQKGIAAYAAMDRAQQSILMNVRKIIGQSAEWNARQAAQIEHLADIPDRISKLIEQMDRDALAHSSAYDLVEQVREVLTAGQDFQARPERPVVVSMAVDTRFTHGEFHTPNGPLCLPFLGWSLVVHSVFLDTVLEPTFLGEDSFPVTTSQLSPDGIYLIHLV